MSMDRVLEKKKGIKKKHIYIVLGSMVFLFLLYQIIWADHSSVMRVDREKISFGTVEKGMFNDYITIIGQVEPISTIYLDAIEGGRVVEKIIEEGAMVKKGDVILKLENRQLYQTILNSEASLAEKENYLRNTRISFEAEMIQSKKSLLDNRFRLQRKKRNYEQSQMLYEEKLIPREEFLQAKEDYEYEEGLLEINHLKARNDSIMLMTNMKTLDTDLQKMRQMLGLVRERLDNLEVKSPVDGQLGMLDAEIGQSVSQGQRIGMVHVLSDYKVEANVDEHYIDKVRRELPASIERNGQDYNLHVKKVYPEVRDGQFEIDLVFDGSKPENIRTGQTYHLKLQLGQATEAVMIPRGGFFQSTGGQWVFVLNESGTEAVRRNIKIGKQNPRYYEVIEGLEPGEQVITSGYEIFGENERLELR
ncbi:efflux RND transporter periplasmic adaptor subunit [Marinilabilia salmonicolor]|uniref:HlyD family secretion protein n=1 Tax=Marinilabilia salmonicolor TaxID=989 RepID=A0A2T0XP35_9BACT|nr:efflux RND transporter periplasmic adaptor subunit [Marinilabilia salmonicolor]PRZ00694.1 HlyD family secretion protein [Marinilabilia salmonicolor]RCW30792.1 HlyD family secretion protein [Marinilabilia salmonicolor]